MPPKFEFEQNYKKTPREQRDEELAAKDDFGDTPSEIQKNVQAVMEKYEEN